VLQGKAKPADAAECIHFADLCRIKRQFGAAAGMDSLALATRPPMADDLRASFRYNAPIAAILAGSGRGESGAKLSEAQRARWRKQARQWLQTDLAAWPKNWDSGPPADRWSINQNHAVCVALVVALMVATACLIEDHVSASPSGLSTAPSAAWASPP